MFQSRRRSSSSRQDFRLHKAIREALALIARYCNRIVRGIIDVDFDLATARDGRAFLQAKDAALAAGANTALSTSMENFEMAL